MNKAGRYIFKGIIGLLTLSAGFISCSDDEDGYVYPPLLSEFADVVTDASGAFPLLSSFIKASSTLFHTPTESMSVPSMSKITYFLFLKMFIIRPKYL